MYDTHYDIVATTMDDANISDWALAATTTIRFIGRIFVVTIEQPRPANDAPTIGTATIHGVPAAIIEPSRNGLV